jgi:tRNA-2-methylthio-N6-dimethylallyladenosine synthase
MNKKYLYIQTFGCQMNVSDSEKIVTLLEQDGYEATDDAGRADLIVVNTCSIREKAAQKAYSQLGRFRALKERNPELVLAIGGCLAQERGKKVTSRVPFLDIVFGTHQIHQLPGLVRRVAASRSPVAETGFEPTVKSLEIAPAPRNGSVSVYVTIMQGCNNCCSYCVVPYLRGPEESRGVEDVLKEVESLAGAGIREVTLLGQNVNSFGLSGSGRAQFSRLLRSIGRIRGVERIRFTTSHPKDLSDDLMQCFADVEALCPHIHLPVQSGSNYILKRMNRGYSREQYLDRVERLRMIRPDISITSDVIVGFPGEGDADFEATLELMREVRFDNLFSFKYSEREGTAAVALDLKIPERVKRERLQCLQRLQEQHTLERNRALEGQTEEILVEGASRNSERDMTGRTRSNKVVNFTGEKGLAGKTVSVLITKAYLHSLRGDVQKERRQCS